MFRHYANVIEELVGEPRMSAEDQIKRARGLVADKPAKELDAIVADLLERPTLATAGKAGGAHIVYMPGTGA